MALAQRSHECVGSLIIVWAFERVCLVPSSAIDDMCSSPNVIIIIITIERNACVTMHKISKKDNVIKGPVCRIQDSVPSSCDVADWNQLNSLCLTGIHYKCKIKIKKGRPSLEPEFGLLTYYRSMVVQHGQLCGGRPAPSGDMKGSFKSNGNTTILSLLMVITIWFQYISAPKSKSPWIIHTGPLSELLIVAVRCGITAERPLMGVLCVFVEENNLLVWSVTCGVALSKPAAWELLALVKEHLTHLPILYFSQHLSKKRKNGWQAWKWHWACYLLIKPWIGAQKGCQACLLQSPKTQECLYCVWGLHWANRFQSLLVTGWTLTGQRQHLTVCST